jgi:WD40 repeat protein/serine/threonine protein kinase/class 3 adenylate cyclase
MDPRGASAGQVQVEAFGRRHRTGLVTLVFTDMVGSTALKQQLGDHAGAQLIEQHHALVRATLKEFSDGEELSTAGDSFFLVFATPSAGVKFSLVLQQQSRDLSRQAPVAVQDRIGLHLGEVLIQEAGGQRPKDLIGLNVDLGARVMGLAQAGQILMTRSVFDSARQSLKGEEIKGAGELTWLNHGRFELKGIEEPVEICEVRTTDSPTSSPPTSSEKARRVEAAEGEAVLGWRPAVGQAVPNTQWVLEKKLGEGGFGEVWLGRHQTMKERRVFKFCFRADRVRSLKREMTLFRVLKERMGDHPNIVRLLEVYFEEPPFYVVMDHVEGADLKTWCEQQGGADNVPLEAKLEIVAQIADALQAAHDAGVIHRDVKPANILVAADGSRRLETGPSPAAAEGAVGSAALCRAQLRPQARLTDFGIGQVVSAEALAGMTKAGFTQTLVGSESSSQTGTQLYMAPELLAGKPASIRSDIYSLGVVLYQLLVGDFKRPVTTDWSKEVEDPLLREDLALCFAGQPQERFSGAGQLAKNLRALPQRQAARAAEEVEQAAREKAAYRRGVIRTTALAVLLITGFAGMAIYAIQQASRAQRTARAEAYQRYGAEMNLAQQAYNEGRVARAISLLDKHNPATRQQEDLRGFEWRYLWRLCEKGDALHTFDVFSNAIAAVAFSGDGTLVACEAGGAVKVLDISSRQEIAGFRLSDKPIDALVLSARGGVIAAVDGTNTVKVRSISGKQGSIIVPENGPFSRLALSPDGRVLAVACRDRVRLWDWAERREILTLPWTWRDRTSALAFSTDGKLVAAASLPLLFWSVAENREEGLMEEPHTGIVVAMAFSPDGQTLATTAWDTTLKIWDLPSRRFLGALPGHGSYISSLAFSPDGRTLASAGSDGTVKLWDLRVRTNGKLKSTLKGHRALVEHVAFSPDGKLIASASWDHTVKLWSADGVGAADLLEGHAGWVWSVALSPDSRTLASASFDGTIRFWDPLSGACAMTNQVAPLDLFTVAFSPDGKTLASSEGIWRGWRWQAAGWTNSPAPNKVKVWHVNHPRQVLTNLPGLTDWPRALAFSADGKTIASGDLGGWVKLWALPAGNELATFRAHQEWIHALRFSPDGRFFATSSGGGPAKLWDASTLKELAPSAFENDRNQGCGSNLDFSPDSRLLAIGCYKVKLWDIGMRRTVALMEGHKDRIMAVRFSPDGKTVATGSMDHTVKLWSIVARQEVATLEGHTGAVSGLAFSPDGTILASSSDDYSIRLWRAISPEEALKVKATNNK